MRRTPKRIDQAYMTAYGNFMKLGEKLPDELPKKRVPKKRLHPERDLQARVKAFLDKAGLLWCHPPNGGSRHAVEAMQLKRMGVKPGVPDILIFEPTLDWHGLCIELKSDKGKLTHDQRMWHWNLYNRGYAIMVCRTLEEVEIVIQDYFNGEYQQAVLEKPDDVFEL